MAEARPPETVPWATVAAQRLNPVQHSGTEREPKIFVLVRNGLDVVAYRERWTRGLEPDASPYGFHHAAALGGDVRFSTDRSGGGLYGVADRIARKLLGFDLFHAWYNRRAMAEADAIWTMTENEALGACLLMRLGLLPRAPIIGATVWMVNRWGSFGPVRRAFYRWLIAQCAVVTVHTGPCLGRLREIAPNVNGMLMHFGVAADRFLRTDGQEQGATDEPIHIVAAGNDLTRDWDTLIEAFGNDARFRLTVICRRLDPERYRHYTNLTIPTGVTAADIAALYAQASYVAIPMVENIFSGITVAIEAGAMGRPILSSLTGGVATYFAEDEALYARTGDPQDMRDRVLAQGREERAAMARRGQARFLRDDYSTAGMIGRYAHVTNDLLSPAP